MLVLRFGPADAGRVRFAVSPLWEAMAAARVLTDARSRTHHLPWLEAVRPLLAGLDLMPLLALQPRHGYAPDFSTPAPTSPLPDVKEQLAEVRRAPLKQVREEIARALSDRSGEPVPPGAWDLTRSASRARTRVADALESVWESLVSPHWPALRTLLEADIAFHGRLMTERGLEHVLPALHHTMQWSGDALRVDRNGRHTRVLHGEGLLLMPSAFTWPFVAVTFEESLQPSIVYPARGIAELWQPDTSSTADSLAGLIGRSRATILASLREPATTTTLARRHQLSMGTVSEHLSVLRESGLVSAQRRRTQVLYVITELGGALIGAG